MLKYEKIVGTLSISQKIHLLCDISALSSAEYRGLGVPAVRIADLDTYCADYPSSAAMAASWDTSLVSEAAREIMMRAASDGATLMLTPSAKAAFSPYGKGLSEDSVLSSAIAGEYLGATEEYGFCSAIKGFYLTDKETEWLDEKPNGRFIYEQVINPYVNASEKGEAAYLSVAQNIKARNYEKANEALITMASRYKSIGSAAAICEKADAEGTLPCIQRGVICLLADYSALNTALDKYYQMRKAANRGDLSEEEIERAIAEYRAISPENIDAAVDKVIDFAFKADKMKKSFSAATTSVADGTALRAARESVVLLKNDRQILPLSVGKSVCVIGDIAMTGRAENFAEDFSAFLGKEGYNIIGTQRGYELGKERSEKLLESALHMARGADTAIVFLGLGERERDMESRQRLSLPANQAALLDGLGKEKCNVIAVVSGDYPADIMLCEKADAILFAPICAKYSAEALAGIVCGKDSPCGKLARTVYTDSDRILKKQKIYKNRGMKSGPFMGYKYYDTAEFYPGYVFGHGLSYVKFTYSAVSVNFSPTEQSVTFTIKNCGKIRAAEIVQVYAGIADSSVVRPKKELCAFQKIELEAGETRSVTIPFSLPEVFDMEKGKFTEEMGTYTLYIGSSVRDIRLTCVLYAGDAKIRSDGEKATDYLLSESNIISDNYKLEADCKIMKKSVLNIIAGIAALIIAVVLKVYCLATNTNALFFDIIAIILALSAWVFFIAEFVARKKIDKAEAKTISEANEDYFKDAETVEISAAEQLFANEFDVTYSEEEVFSAENSAVGTNSDNMIQIQSEIDIAAASKDFSQAAKEKGIDFSESDAAKLFASMASSRVLLIHGMSTKAFDGFMRLISAYFETAVYNDSVNGAYASPEDILFKSSADERTKTNAMLAIEEAQSAVEKIQFIGFDGVKPSEMTSWFVPIAKHAKNPYARHYFKAHNEQNAETLYHFPQNVWFAVNLTESASYADIPASVAEIATVNSFATAPCEISAASSHSGFTYYQMEYLCDKLVSSMSVGENVWRRFDRLEAFVNSYVTFAFGNKLWLCAERYIAFSMSCGKELEKSIDECLAAKLLPAVIVALNGKMAHGDTSLTETLETVFGEDNVTACRKVVRSCGADIV